MTSAAMHSYEPILPRARIGYIIPSSNRMVEPQLQKWSPPGVVPHFTRIGMTNKHKAPLDKLMPRILEAAELLAESRCDAIVLQCTGTSMSGGVDMDGHVVDEIARTTGCKAASAASSLTAAFQRLGVKKMVFISETAQAGHDKKIAYLREAGYELVADKAVGLEGTDEYCIAPPKLWYDTAMALRNDRADVYFISCANIHSIDTIAALERDLGRPVVTSNQAALWRGLRLAGITDAIPALGKLMTLDAGA